MRRLLSFLVVFTFVGMLPAMAAACPVCGFGEDSSRTAYIATTVFLSVLPLALIGGGIFAIRRLTIRNAREHAARLNGTHRVPPIG